MVDKWWLGEDVGRAQGGCRGPNICWHCFRSWLESGHLKKKKSTYLIIVCLNIFLLKVGGKICNITFRFLGFYLNSSTTSFLCTSRTSQLLEADSLNARFAKDKGVQWAITKFPLSKVIFNGLTFHFCLPNSILKNLHCISALASCWKIREPAGK